MNFLPIKNCIINTMFTNADNPEFYRNEYCYKNCNFKCMKGQNYKKINEENNKEKENDF